LTIQSKEFYTFYTLINFRLLPLAGESFKGLASTRHFFGAMNMTMSTRIYKQALAEARRQNPGFSDEDLEDEGFVDEILQAWQADMAEVAEMREDSPCLESGVHNCNDWGTGEGQFHGRI
jgi:hypothetical protein